MTSKTVTPEQKLRSSIIRLAHAKPELREHLLPLLKSAASRLDRARKHQLMPAAIRSKLPKLYTQEDVADPLAMVKFFSPYSQAVWYVTEFDGRDQMFGWADLGMGGGELGYISLSELEEANRNGLPLVERDLSFRPKPLSQVK